MLNSKRPHFLEGFNPSSSSERLKVPSKFIKLMEGQTSGTVTLVGPSGNTWLADLVQYDDDLFIDYGWETFVRDHFLEYGDSLVFRYDGNLHFNVQIFEQSSCEKEAAFSVECYQDTRNFNKQLGKRREREIADLLDNIGIGVPKKIRSSQVPCLSITKYQEGNFEIPERQEYLREDLTSISEKYEAAGFSNGAEYCGNPSKNSVTVAMPFQSKVLGGNSEAATSNKLLSAPEAERIARSFTSCFPNFTKVMKRFNISGSYTLNIPYQFSMAHLPNCKVKIVLHNVKGESWTVNSIPSTKVQTSHTFCGGWLGFVRDNNINMGDICIFELVRTCELHVQILRVWNEGLDFQSGQPVQKGLSNGCSVPSRKKSGCVVKKMRGISQKVHLQRITKELSDKRVSDPEELLIAKRSQQTVFSIDKVKPLSSQSKIRNAKPVNQKKSCSREKLGFHTTGFMSMKSAPEEKMAAESFISSLPHFVRIMKKFNISGSYTLKVPYQFSMEHLPNCRTEIVLRNLKGESWTVNSIASTKVQTLHTFCGGWMAFVRDNDIQMGDICIFELVGKCEMRVHISGVGKKAQDYQSGKATCNEIVLASMINNRP